MEHNKQAQMILRDANTYPSNELLKQLLGNIKSNGRLTPLIIDISQEEQLPDALTVVRFKMENTQVGKT